MVLSQFIIKEKLTLYLKLLNNPEAERIIQIASPGICFGYSICYRAMRVAGKLPWWQSLLEAIAKWDGQKSTLQQEVELPQQVGKSLTLASLMERACHYLFFNHALNSLFPYLTSLSQPKHLKAAGNFEMLIDDWVISVKHFEAWAGNLAFDQNGQYLAGLLEIIKNVSEDSIFLANNKKHTCTFWFDHFEKKWCFFDSNYLDGKPKSFINSFDLGFEMKTILGENISLWFALLTDSESDKQLLKKIERISLLPDLVLKEGISIMAMDAPKLLLNFLVSDSKRNWIIDGLYELESGYTVLNWLFINVETEALEKFVTYLPKQPDYHMNTCLHYAAYYGHTKLISLLKQAGFDVNLQNACKETPLVMAILKSQKMVVKSLLYNGANPNISNNVGNTPLMEAVILKDLRVVELLLKWGATLDNQNQTGETALMLAAEHQQTEIIRLLLDAGANPFLENKLGLSACDNAIEKEAIKIIHERLINFVNDLLVEHRLVLSNNEIDTLASFSVDKIDSENLSKIFIKYRDIDLSKKRKSCYFQNTGSAKFFSNKVLIADVPINADSKSFTIKARRFN